MHDVMKSLNKTQDVRNHMFLDFHILNSANKIKAVMVIFGNEIKEVNSQYYYNRFLRKNWNTTYNLITNQLEKKSW